jgi:uncharacterized repeat protein (TIGR03803 family)
MKTSFLSAHAGLRLFCVSALFTSTALPLSADSYSVLHVFTGDEGSNISGPLSLAGTTLYGTCYAGGSSRQGTVFKLNTDGTGCTVLWNFAGPPADGSSPLKGVLRSGDTLYGTTYYGGISNHGTVFKLNIDGTGYVVLKHFSGPPDDGASPNSPLVLSGGMLYGTTESGGASDFGTLFKIGTDGSGYTVLKQFTGPAPGDSGEGDGCMPQGRLALSSQTLFGGTTYGGPNGYGVLYRINLDGTGFGIIREGNDAEGDHFNAGLDLSGTTLFGATPWGGGGIGCVFSLNTDGTSYRVLKAFTGFDGVGTSSWLLSGGFIYGTSGAGGISNAGVVFTLQTNGTGFALLKEFKGGMDASGPGSLTISESYLYGAASRSGPSLVFRLALPLPTLSASPQTQTAEAGNTVRLAATADGLAPLSFSWFQDGKLVSVGTNRFLMLSGIQPSQAGSYTVVVTNTFGAVTSPPALLSVISPVPRRLMPALATTVQPGTSLFVESSPTIGPSQTWTLLDSVMLTNTLQWIIDPAPGLPQKFYRARATAPPRPYLRPAQVPALTLSGTVGTSIRVDCINQFGPVDAWQTLDTVILGTSTQIYYDISAPGQPPRLYRLSTLP